MGGRKRPAGGLEPPYAAKQGVDTTAAAAANADHAANTANAAKALMRSDGRQSLSKANSMSPESLLYLHRSTMVDWRLSPVADIAAWHADGSVVAVGYEDAAIELWDTDTWACFLQVPSKDGPELTRLAWVPDPVTSHPRLFASFLDGTISEVDLVNLKYHAESPSYGGAVWSLAASPPPLDLLITSTPSDPSGPPPGKKQRKSLLVDSAGIGYLAAACDDGSVRLLTVESGVPGVAYSRMLSRVEGRQLAVAWHPEGHTIVSGGVDGCIRCWDVSRGIERCRITASVKTGQQLCVWSLAVLGDGTIVAGDSEGGTAFYDPQFGTQIARFTHHQGDVLTVCGTPDGRRVFSSGVDAKVAMFERVRDEDRGTDDWVYRHYKAPHTHDIRALEVVVIPGLGPMLLSGGNDAQLLLYPADKFLQQHPVRVCRAPRRPHVHLAPECKIPISSSRTAQEGIRELTGPPATLDDTHGDSSHDQEQSPWKNLADGVKQSAVCWLLTAQGKKVDVWQLGCPKDVQVGRGGAQRGGRHRPPREGDFVDVVEPPMHVAQVITSGKSGIVCAAISPCGQYVACSDDSRLRLYCLTRSTEPTSDTWAPTAPKTHIKKVGLSKNIAPAVTLAFLPDASALLAASPSGQLSLVDVASGEVLVTADVVKSQKASRSLGMQAGVKRKTASSSLQHPVTHISTSPSGLIATAGSAGVHLFLLRHLSPSSSSDPVPSSQTDTPTPNKTNQLPDNSTPACWQLQHETQVMQLGSHAPVVSLQFSPDGQLLLVARADAAVQLFEAQTGLPSKWSVENGSTQTEHLDRLPGALLGASFRPTPGGRELLLRGSSGRQSLSSASPDSGLDVYSRHELLLHTSSGFCYLDLHKTQPSDSKKLARKRPMKPVARHVAASSDRGSNWRLFNLEHPCLYLGYIQTNAAVLLECPWEDALAQLPAPLYKHQYGA